MNEAGAAILRYAFCDHDTTVTRWRIASADALAHAGTDTDRHIPLSRTERAAFPVVGDGFARVLRRWLATLLAADSRRN